MNDTLGSYWEQTVTSGSSYLLRVVNAAIDTHFDFSIDNHTLQVCHFIRVTVMKTYKLILYISQVIASDFVPIVPYTTTSISIGMGQRYDVIVTANQASIASDFWLRAIPDTFCSTNYNPDLIKGIIHYDDSTATPTTTAYTITENDCLGEPSASIVPFVALTASTAADVSLDDEVTVEAGDIATGVVEKWFLGDVNFVVNWNQPTALLVVEGENTYNESYAVTEIPTKDSWMTLIIEQTFPLPRKLYLSIHPSIYPHTHTHTRTEHTLHRPFFSFPSSEHPPSPLPPSKRKQTIHQNLFLPQLTINHHDKDPIHLHGHDFFVLASGSGTYLDSDAVLQTENPPRRDVQMLPAAGYLVIAWQADNPGVWLAHCQYVVFFLERLSPFAIGYLRLFFFFFKFFFVPGGKID